MKHRDLIKKFTDNGWRLLRNGANHDVYTNGIRCEPVPRHTEIKEVLAQKIIKRNGLQ